MRYDKYGEKKHEKADNEIVEEAKVDTKQQMANLRQFKQEDSVNTKSGLSSKILGMLDEIKNVHKDGLV
jgi:hypothetical protein